MYSDLCVYGFCYSYSSFIDDFQSWTVDCVVGFFLTLKLRYLTVLDVLAAL